MSTQTRFVLSDNNDGMSSSKGLLTYKNGVTVMAITVSRVSANDMPTTGHKGRTRKPTEFDEFMYVMPADECIRVDYEDEAELAHILKQLTKATNYFGLGLDKRDNGQGQLFFRIRERILKPRQAKTDETDSDTPDDDGIEIGEHDAPKRKRSTSLPKAS